jgi:hypothetical protein
MSASRKQYRLRVNGRIVARYVSATYCHDMAQAHARKGRPVTVEYLIPQFRQWFAVWKRNEATQS